MKYPEYKAAKPRRIAVKSMNGGLNLRERPFNIDDGQCSEMQNMWFEGGALRTRPGIKTDNQNIIFDADTYHALWYDISLFGAGVTPLSDPCRLALCRETTMEGIILKFYMLYSDGAVKPAGNIAFYRTSPTSSIFTPKVCSVFYNSSSTGSGIYVMLSMCNYEETERGTHVRFYELSNDLTVWTDVTEQKLYIPTVYINGRGNNFGAVGDEPALSFAPAAFCEPMSMLTGKFRALYGTDGLSHTFKLPFQELTKRSGETVTCRLTYMGSEYLWRISPESAFSNTVELMGESYSVELDRKGGRVTFVDPSNMNYKPLPITELLGNNLEITAYCSDTKYLETINTSGVFCEYSSRLFLSGFEGSPNGIFFSAGSNPFYFPVDNVLKLGSQAGKITALAKQGKLLVAFKAEECHSIDCRSVEEYDMNLVVTGSTKFPSKLSDVRVDILSSEIGCDCPGTLLNCANRLVWLSTHGVIYTIIASNQYSKGNVYELSLNIEPYLKACDKEKMRSAFGVLHSGYYVLFIGNEAVAMDYTIKGFRYVASCSDQKQTSRSIYWYLWKLPEELSFSGGVSINGQAVLLGYRATDEHFWYGTATLSGEEDIIPVGKFGALGAEKREIFCSFRTKSFDFDFLKVNKFINGAYLSIGNKKPVAITLYDLDEEKTCTLIPADENPQATVKRVSFYNTSLSHCALDFKCNGPVQLCGFELYGGI